MSSFDQVVQSLIQRIEVADDEITRIVESMNEPPCFELLDWLEAQPLFPKFYWQSRNSYEEVVALGQHHTFDEPGPAYAMLSSGQRVWGGCGFDHLKTQSNLNQSAWFFLPKIELIRRQNRWSLAVNLSGDNASTIEDLRQLIADVTELTAVNTSICSIKHSPNRFEWQRLVEQALAEIGQHQFKKVVLARQSTLKLDSSLSAAQLLKSSTIHNHDSFHFLLSLNRQQSFIGSTPERLYSRVGRTLKTEALAGTVGRGDNAAQDNAFANWLTQDVKNLKENQYVVDDIVESLSPYIETIDVESNPSLVRLKQVQHLRRRIEVTLKPEINGVQLLAALQPTAAVAGLPRQSSMQFILNNEPFSRGWYAGSIGYLSHESAQFCVAIRSALVMEGSVQLFAGAGIVPGSIAEQEWAELEKKTSTLLTLISESTSAREYHES
ncbi:isochorismate synthase [Vibrio azureus]|uniref:Isochorismate synthase MenF n=1 Tax=Vibrio azureus NBRC 104587 TaxID=1219077 RepID=U3C7T8_9VIBR|nr:isochorismate synthase [Vibrio azureus]AUI85704.1 isochorismate synthase [Vibrio azureus]GAD77444.1 menaquinone-specific isochorismate synthase [Vibrio azureus NBRC 104587]